MITTIQIPGIQIPGIQIPGIQIPAMYITAIDDGAAICASCTDNAPIRIVSTDLGAASGLPGC